jgi:YD repeat-containing protein
MKTKTNQVKPTVSKEVITQVSIKADRNDWHPLFNTIKVGPDDEAGGSYLKIVGEDEMNNGRVLSLDWDEWDNLVEVVAKYRKEWEWTEV